VVVARSGSRLRKGKSADVRGAARFLTEALATVRQITPTATVVVRADAKFYISGRGRDRRPLQTRRCR
jgi:hypothetical protein